MATKKTKGIPSNLIPVKLKTTKRTLYELFKDKSGRWKWRKRLRNGKIPNHQYNTKAAAIKGMKADYKATVEAEFEFKEVAK